MALNIGPGISIGGGISFGSEAGGGGGFVSGNMTVGNGTGGTANEYGWKQGNYGSVTFPDFPTGPSVTINYDSSVANRTLIQLFDGTYGATIVNGTLGTVDAETSATVTIDGIVQTGTWFAGVTYVQLEFVGDVFSLQSKNGQTLAVNMVAAPAPAADVSGTITVGFNDMFGDRYGYQSGFPGPYGSVSVVPDAIATLYNTTTFTAVTFNGTTIGITPTDSMTGLASGITSLSVTVDGITQTISTGGPSPGGYSVAGDPFSLATKNGQTLSLAIDLL